MAQPNANDKIVDGVVTHSVNLLRVAAGQRQQVLAMLQKLEGQLAGEIETAAAKGKSAFTQARLKALLVQTKQTIASAYKDVAETTGDALSKIAQLEASKTVNIINGAIGIGIATVGQSAKQLSAIAGKTLVHGKYPAEWWAKQSEDLQAKFSDQMRMGMLKGEGIPDLVKRVRGTAANAYTDGIMLATKRQAEALVRTSVQSVANEARIATYLKNPVLIKGLSWVATLDNRTTTICRALDGLQWTLPGFEPVGHDKVFPGPVAHWSCRSTTTSVLRSWAELAGPKSQLKKDGKPLDIDAALHKKLVAAGMDPAQAAKVKAETKASMDGQVAKSLTFEDWLKGKPDDFVDALLGPQRAQLWREGKVTLAEMTDQNNRPLTVAELKALIDDNVDVPKQKKGGEFPELAEADKPAPFFDAKKEAELKAAAEKAAAEAAAQAAKFQAEKEAAEKAAAIKAANDAAQKQIVEAYDKDDPLSVALVEINEANSERGATMSPAEIVAAAEQKVIKQAQAAEAKAAKAAQAKAEAEAKAAAEAAAAAAQAAAEKAAKEAAQKAAEEAEAKLQAEAQATIGEILANPKKGQGYLVKAIGETMKKEPGLQPAQVLAAAHQWAAQKSAETVKYHALHGAKKKLLEGGTPSKSQLDVISKLTPEESAAFYQGIAADHAKIESKKAAEAAQKAAEEAAVKKAAEEAEIAKALEKAKALASGIQKATAHHAEGKPGSVTASFTEAEFDAWKGLSVAEKKAFNDSAKMAAADAKAAMLASMKAKLAATGGDPFDEAEKALWQSMTPAEKDAIKPGAPKPSKRGAMIDSMIDKFAKGEGFDPDEQALWMKLPAKDQNELVEKALAKVEAAKVAAAGATPISQPIPTTPQATPPPIAPVNEGDFPITPSALDVVKGLGGSTGAQLVRDPATGALYVRKAGAKPDHVREEMTADRIYAVVGAPVPDGRLYDTAAGPVKLTRYLDGSKTLAAFYTSATPAEIAEIKEQLRRHFALDALIANYDVAGAGNDNILIHQGVAYRVDNGGSLRFRAMGAPKGAAFGNKVTELDSMRDAAVNSNTAAIFAGLTDAEIKGQVIDLFRKRAEILAALPAELRAKVGKRLDDLGDRFGVTEADIAPPPAPAAAEYLPADIGTKIAKARINGRTHLGDAGDVEDLQTLMWQERSKDGEPVTRVYLKATYEGAQRIISTVGEGALGSAPEFPGLKFDAGGYGAAPTPAQLSKVHPKDSFFGAIEQAAKTTATHAADGQYNATTMASFSQAKATLAALAKDQSLDSQGQKMVAQYQAYVSAIEAAQAKTGPLPTKGQFVQFVYTPPKTKAAPVAATPDTLPRPAEGEIAVYRDNAHFETKKIEKGNAQIAEGFANEVLRTQSTPVYRILVGPDVEIKFVRPNGARTRSDNLALQGSIDISVRGGVTRESVAKAHAALKKLGIDLAPPTPERAELVYLTRGVALLEKSSIPPGWKAIIDGPGSEAEKVKQAKAWIAKKYKVKLPDKPGGDYQPYGKPNSFGEGFHVWHRFDLPPAQIEKEMAGYAAWHMTSQPVNEVVNYILESGGEFTNTTMRLRKGISIGTRQKEIGMSPYADLDTGGASYFFTRLRPPGGQSGSGFYFKIRNLARVDAVTFPGDEFGAIDKFGERETTVARYKQIAGHQGRDETIFKNGVNLLDEVEFIKTSSASERQAVLDTFKKHGYTVLPDGRKIADIVR